MTDQASSGTPSSGPGASPRGNTSGNSGGDFVRTRAAQMGSTTMRREMPAQSPGAPAHNNDRNAPGADQRSQQQTPAADQKVYGDFTAAEIDAAMAERAERQMLRSELPQAPEAYQARNTENFKLPEKISFEFNPQDPALAAARRFAHVNNLTQEQFSGMLDLFVSTQVNGLMQQQEAREANLTKLGAAGVQRINSVATFLRAHAGQDGAELAGFIQKWPSAPIVRAMEAIVKKFSSQGGADFSQSHRATPEDTSGRIAGYENMTFAQKRAAQMAQQFGPKRDR